jgi:dGTPase
MLTKADLEQLERKTLTPYAMKSSETRGRDYPISPDSMRTEYQRDRDRIIHSTAFRKLEYKTQVFVIHEGDYYRTRLTHTIEVAQIARSMARNLRLNFDLAEAIALAHDLGHTPFGHSGERALSRLMAEEGGFEHNEQGLRVVEYLEERYGDVKGLNLTWELREGIIKHASSYDTPRIDARFRPKHPSTLEAQIVDIADEIAYNNHDLDDALKLGLVEEEDLEAIDWCWEIFSAARRESPDTVRDKFVKYRAIGKIIDMQVVDALQETERNIAKNKIRRAEDVQNLSHKIASFSSEMVEKNRALKDFLLKNVYQHPGKVRMATKAEKFIEKLFLSYVETPQQLPTKYQERIATDGLKRVICDYISGMTDRYLLEEYSKAFEPQAMI